MKTFTKDPNSQLDYQWDFTDWLGEDTIATAVFTSTGTITINPDDVTIDGALVTAWLVGGGPEGTHEIVTCRVTTASNPPRIDDKSALFIMKEG